MSLREIGKDMMADFICKLLLACAEHKKDAIFKTLNMVKKIRGEWFSDECMKTGYVLMMWGV